VRKIVGNNYNIAMAMAMAMAMEEQSSSSYSSSLLPKLQTDCQYEQHPIIVAHYTYTWCNSNRLTMRK
jgi:hypothetical protein